jgi:hypothetical protein
MSFAFRVDRIVVGVMIKVLVRLGRVRAAELIDDAAGLEGVGMIDSGRGGLVGHVL